jgi:HAE1 family hydrophobic/amphiphilic exporter-1
MTTFALIAGMVPVALGGGEGGDFRAPLGISVIGGVLTSTLLTLLVIPTVYETLADTRDWMGRRMRKSQVPSPKSQITKETAHAPAARESHAPAARPVTP